MNLTPETINLIVQVLLAYGPEAAIAVANLFKSGATIDDAIAACHIAGQKTLQQYKDEAKANPLG